MIANPLPWIALSGAVLTVLYFKGYIRRGKPAVHADDIENMDSKDIAYAYVAKKRREAENKVIAKMAAEVNQSIEDKYGDLFTAPVNLTGGPKQSL